MHILTLNPFRRKYCKWSFTSLWETKKDNYLDDLFEITIQASKKNIDLENEFRKYLNKKQLDIINKL